MIRQLKVVGYRSCYAAYRKYQDLLRVLLKRIRSRRVAREFSHTIDEFERAEIPYWLGGGLACDAIRGTLTRPHKDIDLSIRAEDLARVRELLTRLRFTLQNERRQLFVARRDGLRIDLFVWHLRDGYREQLYETHISRVEASLFEQFWVRSIHHRDARITLPCVMLAFLDAMRINPRDVDLIREHATADCVDRCISEVLVDMPLRSLVLERDSDQLSYEPHRSDDIERVDLTPFWCGERTANPSHQPRLNDESDGISDEESRARPEDLPTEPTRPGNAKRSPFYAIVLKGRTAQIESELPELIRKLKRLGVPFWLGGGLAYDALRGKLTRSHKDIDLDFFAEDMPQVEEFFKREGFHFHRRHQYSYLGFRCGMKVDIFAYKQVGSYREILLEEYFTRVPEEVFDDCPTVEFMRCELPICPLPLLHTFTPIMEHDPDVEFVNKLSLGEFSLRDSWRSERVLLQCQTLGNRQHSQPAERQSLQTIEISRD